MILRAGRSRERLTLVDSEQTGPIRAGLVTLLPAAIPGDGWCLARLRPGDGCHRDLRVRIQVPIGVDKMASREGDGDGRVGRAEAEKVVVVTVAEFRERRRGGLVARAVGTLHCDAIERPLGVAGVVAVRQPDAASPEFRACTKCKPRPASIRPVVEAASGRLSEEDTVAEVK